MLATEPVRMIARVHDRSHWRTTLSADPIVDAVSGERHCHVSPLEWTIANAQSPAMAAIRPPCSLRLLRPRPTRSPTD